jgi:thioredoxin 1
MHFLLQPVGTPPRSTTSRFKETQMSDDSASNILNPSEASFQSEVLESSVPTLVDFWAPWCPPCRLLKPELERLAPELTGRANIAFVNVDEEPAISQAFGVSSIPALFVVKGGKVIDSWTGYLPKAAVADRLSKHLSA